MIGVRSLLTTHDLVDVERPCRRLLITDRGRIIEDNTMAEIRRRHGRDRSWSSSWRSRARRSPSAAPSSCGWRETVSGCASAGTTTPHPPSWPQDRRSCAVRDLAIEDRPTEAIVRRIYDGLGGDP